MSETSSLNTTTALSVIKGTTKYDINNILLTGTFSGKGNILGYSSNRMLEDTNNRLSLENKTVSNRLLENYSKTSSDSIVVYNPYFAAFQQGDYLNSIRVVNRDGTSNIPRGTGIMTIDNRPYLKGSRPSFRKNFEYDLFDYYDGVVKDYYTEEVIDWKPGQPRKGIVDFGHNQNNKYSTIFEKYKNEERTPEWFRNWYNNVENYQFETPNTNRSHRYE